jgi:hypothetical protein
MILVAANMFGIYFFAIAKFPNKLPSHIKRATQLGIHTGAFLECYGLSVIHLNREWPLNVHPHFLTSPIEQTSALHRFRQCINLSFGTTQRRYWLTRTSPMHRNPIESNHDP